MQASLLVRVQAVRAVLKGLDTPSKPRDTTRQGKAAKARPPGATGTGPRASTPRTTIARQGRGAGDVPTGGGEQRASATRTRQARPPRAARAPATERKDRATMHFLLLLLLLLQLNDDGTARVVGGVLILPAPTWKVMTGRRVGDCAASVHGTGCRGTAPRRRAVAPALANGERAVACKAAAPSERDTATEASRIRHAGV
jgi:hypothetical protein